MTLQHQVTEKQNSKKNHMNLEIVEYKPEYKKNYKDLNYEWLNKYFEVESSDKKILFNPETEIIDKNGFIFFALCEDKVVGTCTLIRHDDANYELSKLCVTEKYQRKGIGEKLIDRAISKACQVGCQKIFLSTNRKLIVAYNLYRKKGFTIIKNPHVFTSNYKRESIYMYLDLLFTSDEVMLRK